MESQQWRACSSGHRVAHHGSFAVRLVVSAHSTETDGADGFPENAYHL